MKQTCFITSADKKWITPKLKVMINDKWIAYRTKNFAKFKHLKLKIQKEIVEAKKKFATSNLKDAKNTGMQ